jgi:hypothetical protein
VLKLLPSSRLLLVAPSNLAADLLAQRLLKSGCPKSEMLRICAFSRPKEDLLPDLDTVSNWSDAEQAFSLPPLASVMHNRKRVVVVTALMAGKVSCGQASWVPCQLLCCILMHMPVFVRCIMTISLC